MLDKQDLATMRATQTAAMMDECELWRMGDGPADIYGKPRPLWVMNARTVCGLELVDSRELVNASGAIYDARLRLPLYTDISWLDKVKITHRHGEILDTPKEYVIVGESMRGPSGLVLNLRTKPNE
jgi:hypothetical protein